MKRILVFLTVFLAAVPYYASALMLCDKSVGSYANVIITSDQAGGGISDAFPITIKVLTVRTDDELALIKAMPAFQDESLLWVQKGDRYALYKIDPDRGKQKLNLYQAVFQEGYYTDIMLSLQEAEASNFSKYELNKRLRILAVMGVGKEGKRDKVEFVTQVDIPAISSQYKEVFVRNADHHLKRFAKSKAMIVPDSEDINMPDIYTKKGFDTIMGTHYGGRSTEQYILDTYMAENAVFLNVTGRDTAGAELANLNIDFQYKSCVPAGEENYGHAKAAFIPKKETSGDKYPVYVFPGAFSSPDTLAYFVKRALYHARWWNAVANLANGSVMREAFLRMPLPYLEYDFYQQYAGIIVDATGTDNTAIRYFEHNVLLNEILKQIKNYHSNRRYIKLPWVFMTDIIQPVSIGEYSADREELAEEYSDLIFDRMFGSADYVYTALAAYNNLKSYLNGATPQSLKRELVLAGYDKPKEIRTAVFKGALLALDKDITGYDSDDLQIDTGGQNLLKSAYSGAYAYSDLEWIVEMTEDGKAFKDFTDEEESFFRYAAEYANAGKHEDSTEDRYFNWFPLNMDKERYTPVHSYLPAEGCYSESSFYTDEDSDIRFTINYDWHNRAGCNTDMEINSPDGMYRLIKAVAILTRKYTDLADSIGKHLRALSDPCPETEGLAEECREIQEHLNNVTAAQLISDFNGVKTKYFNDKNLAEVINDLDTEFNKLSDIVTSGKVKGKKYTDTAKILDDFYDKYHPFGYGSGLSETDLTFNIIANDLRAVLTENRRVVRLLDKLRLDYYRAVLKPDTGSSTDMERYNLFSRFTDAYDIVFTKSKAAGFYGMLAAEVNANEIKKNVMGAYNTLYGLTAAFVDRYGEKLTALEQYNEYLPESTGYLASAAGIMSRILYDMDAVLYERLKRNINTDMETALAARLDSAIETGFGSVDDVESFLDDVEQLTGLSQNEGDASATALVDSIINSKYRFPSAAQQEDYMYRFLAEVISFERNSE